MDYLEECNNTHCSEDENMMTKNASTLRSRATTIPQIMERQPIFVSEVKPSPIMVTNEKSLEEASMPLDIADFECSLCFRLFCKPTTTSCGHTYCKNCLLSSLKFSSMCPLCRNQLPSTSKFKYNVNIVLMNVLEKHFKEQYQLRSKEEEEEEEASLISAIDNDKEVVEDYYTTWTSCLIPPVRETCCVLLSCT